MDDREFHWLHSEIKTWVHANIITPEQAKQIGALYPKNNKMPTSAGEIASWFSAALIGLGIILLLAYHWDNLPRLSRLAITIVLLMVSQFGTYLSMTNGKKERYLEAWSLFQTLMVGASIALISQTYHIHLQFDYLLLVWMALTLPLAYLLRSIFPVIMYAAIGCLWCLNTHTISVLWFGWLAVAALLPLFKKFHSKPFQQSFLFWSTFIFYFAFQWLWVMTYHGRPERWLAWGIFIVLLVLYCKIPVTSNRYLSGWFLAINALQLQNAMDLTILSAPWHSFMIYAISITALGRWLENKEAGIWRKPFSSLGLCFSLLGCLYLTFQSSWIISPYNVFEPSSSAKIILGYAVFISFCLWRTSMLYTLTLTDWMHAFIAPLFLLLLLLDAPLAASVIMNLYLLICGLLLIKLGINQVRSFWLNSGLTIISLLILARFFDTDLSYLMRGIIFILLGSFFFIANRWISRRKKEAAQDET